MGMNGRNGSSLIALRWQEINKSDDLVLCKCLRFDTFIQILYNFKLISLNGSLINCLDIGIYMLKETTLHWILSSIP